MSETHVSRGNSPIVRMAIASWIGTSIEWCDFFLYRTAAALVLGPLFFSPKLSPLAAQLSAFATFWVGFAARPVGVSLPEPIWTLHRDQFYRFHLAFRL